MSDQTDTKRFDDEQRRSLPNAQLQKQEKLPLEELSMVYLTSRGTVGQGNNKRKGILVGNHFVTDSYYPNLDPNDTITVKLGSGNYESKPYQQWIVGSIILIPLEGYTNLQLNYVDKKLNKNSKLFMFSDFQGRIQKIPLEIDQEGNIEYVVQTGDSFLYASHESPAMTFFEGKPIVYCIRGHNQPQKENNKPKQDNNKEKKQDTKQKGLRFTWHFNPILERQKIQMVINNKKKIKQQVEVITKYEELLHKEKKQLGQLQEEIKNYIGIPSNSSDIYTNQRLSTSIISQVSSIQDIIKQMDIKKQQLINSQIAILKQRKLSYEKAEKDLTLKIKDFCRHKHIEEACDITKLLRAAIEKNDNPQNTSIEASRQSFSFSEKSLFLGQYNRDNALRKFQLLQGVQIEEKMDFLDKIVKRTCKNMKFVASWPKKTHLLAAKSIKEESKDGKFGFSYETVMCECGCKDAFKAKRPNLHEQNMMNRALNRPLLFVIAVLDAIIEFEEHCFIHNDIEFRNFIYYEEDFLLGDFDLSCFVKDVSQIKVKDHIEQELNRLNLGLIQSNKQVTKHLKKNEQQINIFFRHTEGQLDRSEGPDQILNRVKQTMSKSHQTQFKALLEQFLNRPQQCNILQPHIKQIKKMLEMFNDKNIRPIEAYMKIKEWAQEKLAKSSIEGVLI